MSNINYNKKIKPFGILIASLVVVLVAIITTLGITGAWFTDNDTKTKDSSTPNIAVGFVNSSGTTLEQEIVLNTSTTVSVKVDANVDVYIRASIMPQFYDSEGNIITGLDVADYYTISYKSGWSTPSGYQNSFLYYNLSNTVGTASTTSAITTQLITGVSATGTALPANVSSVKLQMFAEAVQGNSTGLAKWQTA